MRQPLLLPLALLASGLLLPATATAENAAAFVERVLQSAPPALHDDLDAALQPLREQPTNDFPASADAALDEPSGPKLLAGLFSRTRNPRLQADADFRSTIAVADGHPPSADLFATALAGFLAAPDFSCRQPLLDDYFRRRYAVGIPPPACNGAVPFRVASRYDGMETVWVDPQRVRSIHVLFAGKGTGIASRFGHVALRLVICPTPSSSTADCDANLREHLVLGYQAHINELGLDMMKALTGGYRAYLFASHFMDTYQDYAIGEFREMYSLPLRLETEQRERMVRELAELHWRYDGDYRFFSRNCTTLLQQTLHLLLQGNAADPALAHRHVRPDRFFAALRKSPLAEGGQLTSLPAAEREGFFFSSTRPFYEQAAQAVRQAMPHPDFTDLDDYLQRDPRQRRRDFGKDGALAARLAGDTHLLDAQLMLEELAFTHSEQRLGEAAARYFRRDFPARSARLRTRLDADQRHAFDACLLASVMLMVQPPPRYPGIPSQSGLPEDSTADCQSDSTQTSLHQSFLALQDDDPQFRKMLSASIRDWEENLRNVEWLRALPAAAQAKEAGSAASDTDRAGAPPAAGP